MNYYACYLLLAGSRPCIFRRRYTTADVAFAVYCNLFVCCVLYVYILAVSLSTSVIINNKQENGRVL